MKYVQPVTYPMISIRPEVKPMTFWSLARRPNR